MSQKIGEGKWKFTVVVADYLKIDCDKKYMDIINSRVTTKNTKQEGITTN